MDPRSNWHDSRRLGSGSYGSVYKSRESGALCFALLEGELEDGSEVAIKAGTGTSAFLFRAPTEGGASHQAIDLGALGASGTAPEMAGFEEEAASCKSLSSGLGSFMVGRAVCVCVAGADAEQVPAPQLGPGL